MGSIPCNSDNEEFFGRHSIHLAALEGNTTALEATPSNELSMLELLDRDHCTPLQCVILADKPDPMQLFLNKGADPASRRGVFSANGSIIDDNDVVTTTAVFGRMTSLNFFLNSGL